MRLRAAIVASLVLGGCPTTTPGHGSDAGHPVDAAAQDAATPHDAGPPVDAYRPPVDTGPTTMDAGCSPPSTLHPPHAGTTATIYCPFGMGDAGASLYCDHGTQHCCEPTSGTATCEPLATACTGGIDWQCQGPSDCPSGQVCCGTGTLVMGGPGCANFASGFHGAQCATTCMASEITMCTSDAECAGGTTCTPFRTHGAQVGGCQ